MTFRIDDLADVAGRPLLDAFVMLLSAHRLLGVAPERALPALLAESLQSIGRGLSADGPFRTPPSGNDRDPARKQGVAVLEFPRWYVCQNQACRALVHQDRHGLEVKNARRWHRCERGGLSPCVPVRFVQACARGHLDDFSWVYFVHGSGPPCSNPMLRFDEGPTGNVDDIMVRCLTCKLTVPLRKAWAKPYGTCTGKRPWLGKDADESACNETMRPLVRTASNSYFPQVMCVVSIPEATDTLKAHLQSVWKHVHNVDDASDVAYLRKKYPDDLRILAPWDDAAILAAVQERRDGSSTTQTPLRSAEYPSLARATMAAAGDIALPDTDFFARTPPTAAGALPAGVARFVTFPKLREVVAQVGFTRLEPASADVQGECDLGVRTAALGLATDWLPAYEIRGEGIFLELDETAVQAWLARDAVQARVKQLHGGHREWVRQQGATTTTGKPPEFFGGRYYLLHTLSHLLMTSISLACGYPASAIRERIYCGPSESDPATPMAGILLSTGTAGSGGTLGGLAEQARHLSEPLARARDAAMLQRPGVRRARPGDGPHGPVARRRRLPRLPLRGQMQLRTLQSLPGSRARVSRPRSRSGRGLLPLTTPGTARAPATAFPITQLT